MKLLPIFLVVLLAACSGGGGGTTTSNVPNSEDLNVTPTVLKPVMVWNGTESWDNASWK